ncbi:uncharacterized protein LOC115455987 [Manduca sexta]|uniref:Uncharacterized protein n=1 Tax=Manduca sexta TaxID=7130 RepID=A0A922CE43_MANSE|nr:uncharacterized protein LOC115455987 [Manduca sexta]KAG6443540.1 hypothetical protein O3G_MSEX002915 [Manduca sexta]
MFLEACKCVLYCASFLSLVVIDYALGNGFVDLLHGLFCKIICFVKRTIREETKDAEMAGSAQPINLSVLFTEILLLSLTIAFLNRYKQMNTKDRIDELLKESKQALWQTNEFLEKWRLRRVPTAYSYLDEEPQEIKPLKLEVPILHMAIVDTLGTTRSQPERGDAGDTVNITDSTLLSVTSLLDDESESIIDRSSEEKVDEMRTVEFNSRYLWDVVEEDATDLHD